METSTTSCTSDWRRVASTPPWRRCRAPDATTTRFSSRAPPTRDFSARRRETKRRAARRRRRERRTPRRSTARPRAPRAPVDARARTLAIVHAGERVDPRRGVTVDARSSSELSPGDWRRPGKRGALAPSPARGQNPARAGTPRRRTRSTRRFRERKGGERRRAAGGGRRRSRTATRSIRTPPPFARRRARRDSARRRRRLGVARSWVAGAARALVRGAQIEMAAALMLSAAAGDLDAFARYYANALRRCANGTSLRSAVDVGTNPRGRGDHNPAARRLAEGDDVRAAGTFRGEARGARGGASAQRRALLGGVGDSRGHGDGGGDGGARRTRLSPATTRGTARREAFSALVVVGTGTNATAYEPTLRAEVTLLRCFLSALALGSAGYTPAQHSLYHHARSALKSMKGESAFPRSVAYISLHQLAHMSEVYPGDAVEGLTEVAEAASVSAEIRDAAADIAARVVVAGETRIKRRRRSPRWNNSRGITAVDWTAGGTMQMVDRSGGGALNAMFVNRRDRAGDETMTRSRRRRREADDAARDHDRAGPHGIRDVRERVQRRCALREPTTPRGTTGTARDAGHGTFAASAEEMLRS